VENKSRGILYLALGEEFDKLTAATAAYSRKYTDFPICVITNLKTPCPTWSKVSDVSFTFIDMPTEQNRKVKVSLVDYTPFDYTLFLDSDAVIQQLGIETWFRFLDHCEIGCQFFATLHQNDRNFEQSFVKQTYDKLARVLGESYPINLMGEAAFLFRRTDRARKFFKLWTSYWVKMGCGRDMPAFTFAVKHLAEMVMIFGSHSFCTNSENESFFIQHKGFGAFEKKFGLPEYKDWDPKL